MLKGSLKYERYEYNYKQTLTYLWAINMCLEWKSSSFLSVLNEENDTLRELMKIRNYIINTTNLMHNPLSLALY
jgi:hypothetical protein